MCKPEKINDDKGYLFDLTLIIGQKFTGQNFKTVEIEVPKGMEPLTTTIFDDTSLEQATDMVTKELTKELDDKKLELSNKWLSNIETSE